MSHSGRKAVKLKCGFSNTPGEIVWASDGTTITNDALHQISQRLLDTDQVLYEGVLEINTKLNGVIPTCTIFSIIIGNHADPIPASRTIGGELYNLIHCIIVS